MAACLVVLDHCAGIMALPENFGRMPSNFLSYGYIGVPIFFCISGFIICVVSLDQELNARVKLFDYAVKRFLRIVPFMWICIVAYAVIRFAGTRSLDIYPAIRAMLLWPIGTLRPNVIWTLRHEAIFYTVFALTMIQRRQMFSLLLLWFISPIIVSIFQFSGVYTFSKEAPIEELILNLFSPVNLCFGAGCALGMVYLKGTWLRVRAARLNPVWCILSVAIAVGVACAATLNRSNIQTALVLTSLSAAVLLTGIVASLRQGRFSSLGVVLGDASYSIYLTHNLFILIIIFIVRKFDWISTMNVWQIYFIMVFISIILGIITHYLVEKRVIAVMRRWAGKL